RTDTDLPCAAFATAANGQLLRAGEEARRVAALTGGRAYIDADFTADTLRSILAAGTRLLHTATHFTYVPGRPDQSTLLLGDGTKLPLSSLAGPQFDFSRVELVVLSGCDTAISDALDLG